MPSTGDAFPAWDTIIQHIKQLAAAHARGDSPTGTVPAVLGLVQFADDIPLADLKQNKVVKLVLSMKVRWQGHICPLFAPTVLLSTWRLYLLLLAGLPASEYTLVHFGGSLGCLGVPLE